MKNKESLKLVEEGDAKRMKICYIASVGSVHAQRWVNYFAQNGHEVHFIHSAEPIDGYDEKVRFHSLTKFLPQIQPVSRYLSVALWPLKVRKLLNRIKPDVLHAHYITVNGYLAALSGFSPLVLTAWGSDILIDPQKSFFLRILTKYTLKKADLITCDAHHLVENLIKQGVGEKKVKLIYFGVDTKKFKAECRDTKLREELGAADSQIVISCRLLKPIYDVESLVKAIPLVLREVPEAKFIIASDGPQRSNLEKLASPLGNTVKFTGWLPNDEIPRYLATADIYVSTSLSDGGIAASTAEAMASGVPVIVTDFGDNRKWVKDGINGFIIPSRNPEALASRIVYLLQNESERKQFGQRNRQIIEEKNNWEKEMGKMENCYKELIEKYRK